jgi:hypothetical protein
MFNVASKLPQFVILLLFAQERKHKTEHDTELSGDGSRRERKKEGSAVGDRGRDKHCLEKEQKH